MHQQFSDDQAARSLLSRREVLGGGLLLTVAALSGCSGPQRTVPTAMGPTTTSTVKPYIPGPMPVPVAEAAPVSNSGSVSVIGRTTWTRSGPIARRTINPMNGVSRITVHHEGDDPFTATSQAAVANRLERIRSYHVTRAKPNGEKWADIAYHYIIDPAGRVWEGRSVSYQGAHVKDENEHNLGVMVLGNFDKQQPTMAAKSTLDAFVADQMRRFGVPRSRVHTHRELQPTECPGRYLQSYMVSTRARGGRLALAAAAIGLA